MQRAAAGITLYHEEVAGGPNAARELLQAAERICFLGFSYHQLNVARLKLDRPFDLRQTVIGTARGLRGIEISDAGTRVARAIGGRNELFDADNLDILRQHMFLG